VTEPAGERATFMVRPATTDDRADIQRVLLELYPDGVDGVTLPHIRQEAQTFVATNGDQVVGVAVATLVDYGREAYGSIEELVVESRSRGHGIGRELLDQCLQWLQASGAEVVFVSALDDDVAAFYQSAGFARCTGPWLSWVPNRPT